jgi:putative CocE/NonD family hydrolase
MTRPLSVLLAAVLLAAGTAPHSSLARPSDDSLYVVEHYAKRELLIPMRDGVQLFTAVYSPRDTSVRYPILMVRTPYSVAPYGEDQYPGSIGPSSAAMREGFIMVYQDVRGTYMSEGEFEDVRPQLDDRRDGRKIDESSDTYDAIDWLVKNIPRNNGNVGLWGISYPGFYAMAGALSGHPALKAASPQAPVCDWFVGDDTHHNGAFFVMDEFFFSRFFGLPRPAPTKVRPGLGDLVVPDVYRFFLDAGPVANLNVRYLHDSIAFWNQVMKHGTYDAFWQDRSLVRHVNRVSPAILMVGGWFDAEDLYGPLALARRIRNVSPGTTLTQVMGPWPHGGWNWSTGESLGDVSFGSKTAEWYQRNVELPFFVHHLKGTSSFSAPAMISFETGSNRWMEFPAWPPAESKPLTFTFGSDHMLVPGTGASHNGFEEFVSDPAHPVPYSGRVRRYRSVDYMIDDQRFATMRPDVVTFTSAILTDTVTVAGTPEADIWFSTTGTDADIVVKLIDVYPDTTRDPDPNPGGISMGGYQQLVRAEIMRGKFRRSFSDPEPFVPGRVEEVRFALRDVDHAFLPGHRIMAQIQSSWFPLVDRNPQTFCDVYTATEKDFIKATQRVYWGAGTPSGLVLPVLRRGKE